MKRAALVATGTAIGVGVVTSIHAVTPSTTRSGSALAATNAKTTGTSTTPSMNQTTSTAASHRSSTTSRSALGQSVDFRYGQLQVKVTERAGKITNVAIASFQIADPRSEQIDAQAVPELRDEVLQAQSAKIDGVSGASYTSQAYKQSIQAALDKLR